MITAEIQIHGYNKGHQLLASSVVLSKEDQLVIDRLSDVAGPLRPRELFAPYLSAYPLPSGKYYVLARTWQDVFVSRAGCVRTKSVLIDAEAWSFKPPIYRILRQLDSVEPPNEAEAVSIEFEENVTEQLPPVSNFNENELLEALFLEDMKPVVVFDAADPELIALRLLTALWPDIRQRFTLSTFALSPRKIDGRHLDLVFAPSNVKSKFSDWPGRRVNGRSSHNGRHRWTESIVQSVFQDPVPRLLSDQGNELFGNHDSEGTNTLRIALLWDEMFKLLDQTPNAVLGLLDIANSGMVNKATALRLLEPRLEGIMKHAADELFPTLAWDFVSALANKLQGNDLPTGRIAVEKLAEHFAKTAPDGAINLLRTSDVESWIEDLIPGISLGLGNGFSPRIEELLLDVPTNVIALLVAQGGALTARVAQSDRLIERIGGALNAVDQELAEKVGTKLLPFLKEDRQLVAAIPIFNRLNINEATDTLRRLGETNDFQAILLCNALVNRAIEVNGLPSIRNLLISTSHSENRDALLLQTVSPIESDVLWLLQERRLNTKSLTLMLESVLRRASETQFTKIFTNQMIGEQVVKRLPINSTDLLARVVMQNNLPMDIYLSSIRSLLLSADESLKYKVALSVIGRCMRNRFDGDEIEVLCNLLGVIGARLDGAWIVSSGLERSIDDDIASRNLIAFERAPFEARKRIVRAVDEIAIALYGRPSMGLIRPAYEACARLMMEAEQLPNKALTKAAKLLIPSLLSAKQKPVSRLIAALFPVVYEDILRSANMHEMLRFVPFVESERCKNARQKLVDAFMHSSWQAGDLALTALICKELPRVLDEVAKSYGGKEYLIKIENDLERLNEHYQDQVKTNIKLSRLNKPSRK